MALQNRVLYAPKVLESFQSILHTSQRHFHVPRRQSVTALRLTTDSEWVDPPPYRWR